MLVTFGGTMNSPFCKNMRDPPPPPTDDQSDLHVAPIHTLLPESVVPLGFTAESLA